MKVYIALLRVGFENLCYNITLHIEMIFCLIDIIYRLTLKIYM